jgi:Exostosin family
MAKVLLHSVTLDADFAGRERVKADDPHGGKWLAGACTLFRESAGEDAFGVHSLTEDPEEADLIVFAELGAEGLFSEWVRHHPWMKKYREKCFIFDVGDRTLPFVPGLYASLKKGYYDAARTKTGYYLRLDENPFIVSRPLTEEPKYLGCFVGSLENHPVRVELAKMAGIASGRMVVEDTSAFAQRMLYESPEDKAAGFWPHYADTMAASAFALCPRGRGPGSIRLYEALCMGRAPVIIADEWVYPDRVNWKACSVTVAEKDIARIPEILEGHLSRAAEMGLRARAEWEKFYAPEVRFHWLVEDCLALLGARRRPEWLAGTLVWRYLFTGETLKRFALSKKQIYRQTGRVVV